MDISKLFRKVIIENEGDSRDPDYWVKFTDPDGERSGKSGWSFGRCQFDIANNPLASICLKECGFTDDEVTGLKLQTIDVRPLEAKLRANSDIIARYDDHQLEGCLTRAKTILERYSIIAKDDAAIIAVADYDNQYHLSAIDRPGYLVHFLSRLSRPFIAKDVLDFKLAYTKYGKEHPVDCSRRYMNVLKITQNEA